MSTKKRPAVKATGVITTWLRVALGLLSAAGFVVGYFAIMRPDTPEVGGVAFVAMSGLLLVLAVIGRVPRTINAGGMSLEFPDAQKIADAAESLPPNARLRFAEELRTKTEGSPEGQLTAELIRTGAEFEKAVLETLAALGLLVTTDGAFRDAPDVADGVVLIGNHRYIVEIKARWSDSAFKDLAFQLASARVRESGISRGLLILPDSEAAKARSRVESGPPYPVPITIRVTIVGLSDLAFLRDAFRD